MKLSRLSTLLAAAVTLSLSTLAGAQANTPVAVPGATAPASTPGTTELVAPDHAYVKLDEPITIRFLESHTSDAGKIVATVGPKAADVPSLFSAAAIGDVVDASGAPLFQVYNFVDKKPLAAKAAKVEASATGGLDISALYPDIKTAGTYVLTWKDSTPLVISYEYSPRTRVRDIPGQVAAFRAKYDADLAKMPEAARNKVLEDYTATMGKPVAIHIVPLEYAVIKTDSGEIKAAFYYADAPHTIDNYISLAKQNFYDNLTFHRILKGFMIQGGDALGNTLKAGQGGPGYQVNAEFSDRPHERGVLSMARSTEVDSAGSQFFIMHDKKTYLDGKYTAFGQVLEGMDVVDKIAETPADSNSGEVKGDRPKILSIRILPASAEQYGIKK